MPATLKSRLPAIVAGLDPKVNAAVRAGAEVVAERAREKAPDAPPLGEGLVEAIRVEDNSDGSYVLTDWKAHFLEFGTVNQSPQPFLIPAAEESLDDVAGLVTVALRSL
jgi:HK97 gp10 family phage protein